MSQWNPEQRMAAIRQVLVESLAVEEHEVAMEKTLVKDLGMESIDLLDLSYRLERAFSIKIPRDELFPDLLMKAHEEQGYSHDGKLTQKGFRYASENFSWMELDGAAIGADLYKIQNDVLTVGYLDRYIEYRLGAEPETTRAPEIKPE